MKLYKKLSTYILTGALLATGLGFSACSDDKDEFGTNQYVGGGVHLNVFGPSPVARGGELRFLGSGMSKVTSIEIPGCDPITDIHVISDEEIRVTVPQTAQPGNVVLKFADGSITTKTMLSYLEPISIESFSPESVLPGQEITIKGEYLNLIKEVIFADEVTVAEDAFTSHSRSEIKVVVPEQAQTGKFIISDGAPELPNWIYSDTELTVVLPSVDKTADLTNAKPGDVISIPGKNLDLVRTVLMPSEEEVEFKVADNKITFTLPDNVSDGAVVAIPASGVKVAIATIGVVVPTEMVAEPAEGLRAGDELKIKGVNMDMVSTVSFPNVAEAVQPISVEPTFITVVWPEMAQSGEITLNLKSGKTVTIEASTAKPEVTGFNPNPVSAAAEFTMTGKNLDLVTEVIFGDIHVDVAPTAADQLTLTAPATASSGNLTLVMANGESVETSQLNIDAPQCAYIAEVLTEELHGAELMQVKVVNGDKLTEVQVNGQTVQHIINGEYLFILLPQTASAGSEIKLISTNGEIAYTYDVIPATHVENVIWSGAWECAGWGGNQDLAWGGFDWSSVPAGSTLTVFLTPTVADGEWWCISFRHGEGWGNLPGNVGGQIDMPNDGTASIELSQEVIDDLVANNGLVLTGTGYIMTKITISYDISLEQTLWEGEAIADDWGNQPYLLSDAGLELAEAGAKAGQTVYFYMTPLDSDWKVEILEGHWGPSYGAFCAFGSDTEGGKFTEYDLAANKGRIGIVLTQEMLDTALTQQWWGGTFLLNGDNIKCTKVTIE